jgi:DNA polymerase-3 subunit beta
METFSVKKNEVLEKLNLASRFLQSRLSTSFPSGVLFKIKDKQLYLISSNLSSFYQGQINLEEKVKKELSFIIEPRDVIDFINLLTDPRISFLIDEKKIVIKDERNQGVFQRLVIDDYPFPSPKGIKKQKIDAKKWEKIFPMVIFSASSDESRPVLTGVYFNSNNDENLDLVATDGFRLSLYREKKEIDIPSLIIPSSFLEEIIRIAKNKDVFFSYLTEEKMVYFQIDNDLFFTQLIEGDFPPYEKVIPNDTRTKIVIDKEELLRNTKLIAIFARSISNIVIFEIKNKELILRPKTKEEETSARQDLIEFEGEEQSVAFNYKFIIDFLNHTNTKEVEINILKPDAPVIFKPRNNPHFLHIIMPVRITE